MRFREWLLAENDYIGRIVFNTRLNGKVQDPAQIKSMVGNDRDLMLALAQESWFAYQDAYRAGDRQGTSEVYKFFKNYIPGAWTIGKVGAEVPFNDHEMELAKDAEGFTEEFAIQGDPVIVVARGFGVNLPESGRLGKHLIGKAIVKPVQPRTEDEYWNYTHYTTTLPYRLDKDGGLTRHPEEMPTQFQRNKPVAPQPMKQPPVPQQTQPPNVQRMLDILKKKRQ